LKPHIYLVLHTFYVINNNEITVINYRKVVTVYYKMYAYLPKYLTLIVKIRIEFYTSLT